jgi:hypothetical protein
MSIVHRRKSQTPKIVNYSHNPQPKTTTSLLDHRAILSTIGLATASLGLGGGLASRTG